MRVGSIFARFSRVLDIRLTALVGATLALVCVLAAPALARTGPPVYTLKISEGETTLPEHPIVQTSGTVEPNASVAIAITRGGTEVARGSGEGGAWMSQVPQVGDVVSLQSPIGSTVGAVVYDGLPSMDPSVCAGSTDFSGSNSSGETVKGSYVTLSEQIERYGASVTESNFGRAQVTMLSGTTFGGSFLTPLALGETVTATESLETPLAGGAVFKYVSENSRPVGACPPPPPPAPAPPPPPPALQGTLLRLARATILTLLRSGWHDRVTINQPGTVIQDLYLQNGKLPAYAARSGHHAKRPPALLLARGIVTAKSAGTVSVRLKLTSKGRHRLKSARAVRVVLITTLRTASGAKLNLPRRTITLHR